MQKHVVVVFFLNVYFKHFFFQIFTLKLTFEELFQ